MLDAERAARLLERGTIEVAPIAFMRGRTLNDAFVILDEAQNTTSEQMKMFLTRLGFGSKAVVTGDITQIDLPTGRTSGLVEALKVVGNIEGIAFIHFDDKDVVRHKLVQQIVKAYEIRTVDPDSSRACVVDGDRRPRPARSRDGGLARWLGRASPRPARAASVAIALVTDARIRALNRQYRGKDYATDVLSFPADGLPGARRRRSVDRVRTSGREPRQPRPARFLGDIVIATGVARRQAREARPRRTRPSCGCWRCMGCCTFLATITTTGRRADGAARKRGCAGRAACAKA